MDLFKLWIKRRFKLIICMGVLALLGIQTVKYYAARTSVLTFQRRSKLADNELVIISTDTKLTQPELINIGKIWSMVPLAVNSRCTILTAELPELVLRLIKHGARYVYITSDTDDSLSKILNGFHYEPHISIARYAGDHPEPLTLHFHGVKNIDTLNSKTSFDYELSLWNTSLIQHLVTPTSWSPEFESRAPPMLLPFGKHSPFSLANTLFHYNAFWALTPYFGNENQWSLIVQRLLQELDNSVMFKTIFGIEKSTCSVKFHRNAQLKKDLSEWKCVDRSSFYQCIKTLCSYMIEKKYMMKTQSDKVTRWLEQLSLEGYVEPMIQTGSQEPLEYVFQLIYRPNKKETFGSVAKTRFSKWCPAGLSKCPITDSNKLKAFKPFEQIVLVIVFNRANHYDSLDYLEKLYRPHFRYIQVCGLDMKDFRSKSKQLNTTFSFLQMNKDTFHDGYKHHQCIEHVSRIGYDTEGYLVVGDDVLVNIWNLVNMPLHNIWFQQDIRPANLTQAKVPDVWRHSSWWPWESGEGRVAITKAIKELETIKNSDRRVESFLEQLAKNAQGKNRVYYSVSDMYYIPNRVKDLLTYFFGIFSKHNVYSEITIPTFVAGVSDLNNTHTIQAAYLWYEDRVLYEKIFHYNRTFQHPIKVSPCFKDKKCTKFLCEKYLPCVTDLPTF